MMSCSRPFQRRASQRQGLHVIHCKTPGSSGSLTNIRSRSVSTQEFALKFAVFDLSPTTDICGPARAVLMPKVR